MIKHDWKIRPGLIIALVCLILTPCALAQQQEPQIELPEVAKKNGLSGKLQIGIHYGPWTLKPFSNYFEDDLLQEISKQIRRRVNDTIIPQGVNPGVIEYDDELTFSTSGYNLGFEIRFFPKGPKGSFSLGFSIERTKINIRAEGPINQNYYGDIQGASSTVEGFGYITTDPVTMNLSFRWDTNPSWRVSPYFVTGFGLATLLGEVVYEWTGSYQFMNVTQSTSGSDVLTFQEVEWETGKNIEDSFTNIPNIFYLFQLNVGVRARITPHFYINGEIGFWDGMIFRAGVFYGF